MIVETGDKIAHRLKDGEGILYVVVEDLVNPFKMVKTLSKDEIKLYR